MLIFYSNTLKNVIFYQNVYKNENEQIVRVATLKVPVATCDDWRQGWITLL